MADSSNAFDVETFLRSLKATKPPWECPKCHKLYKSYIGIEYHLHNFDHTAPVTTPNKPISARKSKLKFSKRKKNNRFSRRSPSPIEFLTQTRETLTWAEAQRMVEVESEGKVYRLNIDEKLDIISDSDIDKDDESIASNIQDSNSGTDKVEKTTNADNNVAESTPAKSGSKSTTKPANEKSKEVRKRAPTAASKLPKPSFRLLPDYDAETNDAPERSSAYYRYIEKPAEEVAEEIEYDMDEEDTVWLELMNELRTNEGLSEVTSDQLELLMDRFEKESYFEQEKNGFEAQGSQPPIDENAVCCVCNDGECENSNAILFCDMCNLAVHQDCYGVPYIPEGQWLCRRCLQSPSCPVDCCLCPSKTGAFKQTDDGRWAHVVCALWIPEVTFGNTVFLEPIDGFKNVPPARWKLTCYVCKQRNAGACIQCHKTNCYVAFHVTCAQQAGLYMKMEVVRKTGRNGVTVTVKKEAFCDAHTPTNASPRQNRINGQQILEKEDKKTNSNMKKTRKMIAQKRNETPQISLPYVPKDKIPAIGRRVTIQKKNSFLQRLLSYWTLKRQARSGVPLLRRLQTHVQQNKANDPELNSQQHQLIEQLKFWHRLRHDLERARLLIELIRKRERLKKDVVRISQATVELRLMPFLLLLRRTLDKLEELDVAEVFAEPVTKSEAPDYHDVIKHPMDFSTMAAKIENHQYRAFSEFESDFKLVVDNCLEYNNRDTIFYMLGVKMKDHGGAIVRQTKRGIEMVGVDEESGVLLPKNRRKSSASTAASKEPDKPLAEQLEEMQERLDQAILNSRKTKKIKAEITNLKKKILQANVNTNRLRRRNSTVTNYIGRMATRRFSADDIEPASNAAESEAVVSDVESNFKISPKIRPVKTNRTRKRLWSSKADFAPWQPGVKRKVLERAESCPATELEVAENSIPSCDSSQEDTKSTFSSPTRSDMSSPNKNNSSYENSPSCSDSSNRRTTVLFRKKRLRRMSHLNSPSSDSPSEVTSDCITSPEPTKQSDSDVAEVARSKNEETLINGFNSIPDENVFNDRPIRRRDSYSGVKEEFSRIASLTDSHSSADERQASMKKKRSYSCSVTSSAVTSSSVGSSCDDQSSFFAEDNSDFPFQFLRRQSYFSTTDDELDEEDLPQLSPLDLVWAKCRGYPHYPALLIDPKIPRSGFLHNGVPIPIPPMDVLQIGDKRIENGNRRIYLVLFFDTKRTWQWLPRSKLEPLGVDDESDRVKLAEGRRPAVRRNVETAYKRALHHRKKVTGEIPDSDDELIASLTDSRN